MKVVNDNKVEKVKLGNINAGEVFVYDGVLYMRLFAGGELFGSVNARYGEVYAARLDDGMIKGIPYTTMVLPVESEVHVRW